MSNQGTSESKDFYGKQNHTSGGRTAPENHPAKNKKLRCFPTMYGLSKFSAMVALCMVVGSAHWPCAAFATCQKIVAQDLIVQRAAF